MGRCQLYSTLNIPDEKYDIYTLNRHCKIDGNFQTSFIRHVFIARDQVSY